MATTRHFAHAQPRDDRTLRDLYTTAGVLLLVALVFLGGALWEYAHAEGSAAIAFLGLICAIALTLFIGLLADIRSIRADRRRDRAGI